MPTYIYTYIHMYLHWHSDIKINWNVLLLKKNKTKKTEWLLQQNHRVGGMIEAPNERMDTVYQEPC